MRKLYKIKQTYSIEEAAERLSLTLGEIITPAEVLQLIKEGEFGIFWWVDYELARPVVGEHALHDAGDYIPFRWDIGIPTFNPSGDAKALTGLYRICTEMDIDSYNWARNGCLESRDYMGAMLDGTILCDFDGATWELVKYCGDEGGGSTYVGDRRYPFRERVVITKSELDRFESKFVDSGGVELASLPAQDETVAEGQYDLQHRAVSDAKLILLEKSLSGARAETDWVRAELTEASEKDVRRLQEERDRYRTLNEQLATEVSRLTGELGLASGNPESVSAPDWTRPYIGRATISLADASAILAGLTPIYGYDDRSEGAWRKIDPWCKALIDAVDNSQEISGSSWGSDRSEQALSHADIRSWCAKRGHIWPIQDLNPQPAIHSARDAETPSWLLRYKGRREVSLGDAAVILAGFKPLEPDAMWSDAQLEKIIQWEHVLDDGRESDQINFGADLDAKTASGHTDVMLDHADLLAWSAKRGHDWPIPAPDPVPATHAELAERLSGAEAEIDRLRMVEAESVDLRRHLDTAIASLADANARLSERDASNSDSVNVRRLRDEIGRLKEIVPPRPEFLIPIVVAVQKQFWADWDDSKPRPKAMEEIQPWISANFPQIADSNALVQAVEKVACPFNRNPSARRP